MNKSRVEYAIQVLKTAPKRNKFDLMSWATLKEKEIHQYEEGVSVILNHCGASGCAIGWVASDASVRAEGLCLLSDGFGPSGCAIGWIASDELVREEGLRLLSDGFGQAQPHFENLSDSEAVEEYFDIDEETVERLFSPYTYYQREYHNPKFVIERMELLLASGERLFNEMLDAAVVEAPTGWT